MPFTVFSIDPFPAYVNNQIVTFLQMIPAASLKPGGFRRILGKTIQFLQEEAP